MIDEVKDLGKRVKKLENQFVDANKKIVVPQNKTMCIKCGKYPAEHAQTICEFCMGIPEPQNQTRGECECHCHNNHNGFDGVIKPARCKCLPNCEHCNKFTKPQKDECCMEDGFTVNGFVCEHECHTPSKPAPSKPTITNEISSKLVDISKSDGDIDVTSKKVQSWEERFDQEWGIAPEGSLKYKKREQLKSFISSLLAERNEELKGKIEGMKKDHIFDNEPYCKACRLSESFCQCEGFNQALDDVIEALKKI